MGDMAEMSLCFAEDTEILADQYVNGGMSLEEAYEHGLIDEHGVEDEGLSAAWARNKILNLEGIAPAIQEEVRVLNRDPPVNREYPTCNCCRSSMKPREGRYGKFYFCPKGCESQKCVSDAYWQLIK